MPGAGVAGVPIKIVGNELGTNSKAPISGTPVVRVTGLG